MTFRELCMTRLSPWRGSPLPSSRVPSSRDRGLYPRSSVSKPNAFAAATFGKPGSGVWRRSDPQSRASVHQDARPGEGATSSFPAQSSPSEFLGVDPLFFDRDVFYGGLFTDVVGGGEPSDQGDDDDEQIQNADRGAVAEEVDERVGLDQNDRAEGERHRAHAEQRPPHAEGGGCRAQEDQSDDDVDDAEHQGVVDAQDVGGVAGE